MLVADVRQLLAPDARRYEEVEVADGQRYVNATVSWQGGEAFGLSADLLIEALDWGSGGTPSRGPERLDELRAWLAKPA